MIDKTKVYHPADHDQYRVKMVFDMYHQDVAGLEASFKISVRESICNALELPPSCVLPGDLHDGATGANLMLDLVMFGPNIKSYITKLYEQISNASSVLRQHKYTRKTITAEVSKVCQKDECQEATRLIGERDVFREAAQLAFEDFIRLQVQAETTRRAALDAEKAVTNLNAEMQTMEGDFLELQRIADETTVRSAEANLNDFKRNLREHVASATTTANLARTLMEDVAKARQDAELKAAAANDVSRRWGRAAMRGVEACDTCKWSQDLRRYEEGLYRYQCPNHCGFVAGFFDMANHFPKCRPGMSWEQQLQAQQHAHFQQQLQQSQPAKDPALDKGEPGGPGGAARGQ